MDLVEFLLARITEDEQAAQLATSTPWLESSTDDGEPAITTWGYPCDPEIVRTASYEDRGHILRWNPARVLADCAAKRKIVEHYRPLVTTRDGRTVLHNPDVHALYHLVLRTLATIYADHPDYDETWRV